MGLFDLFRKKKEGERSDIPQEKTSPEPEANLPECNACREPIHEKPFIFKHNHGQYTFHKKCYRKARRKMPQSQREIDIMFNGIKEIPRKV